MLMRVTVAGEIDTIEILQNKKLEDVIEKIKKEAVARAIMAGGDAGMPEHPPCPPHI